MIEGSEIINVNNKKIFICEEHHHVLYFWEKYKESTPSLISFDHHTDTHLAFTNHLGNKPIENDPKQKGLIEKVKKVDLGVILKLKNDEHIDAAIKAGFLSKALIYAEGSYYSDPKRIYTINGNTDYENQPIIINPVYIDNYDNAIEDSTLKPEFNRFTYCLSESIWANNYILDIDLDFFKTCKSINPKNYSFFKQLINNCIAISIAKESKFVNAWKNEYDKNISVDYLLNKLMNIIKVQ